MNALAWNLFTTALHASADTIIFFPETNLGITVKVEIIAVDLFGFFHEWTKSPKLNPPLNLFTHNIIPWKFGEKAN